MKRRNLFKLSCIPILGLLFSWPKNIKAESPKDNEYDIKRTVDYMNRELILRGSLKHVFWSPTKTFNSADEKVTYFCLFLGDINMDIKFMFKGQLHHLLNYELDKILKYAGADLSAPVDIGPDWKKEYARQNEEFEREYLHRE